MPLVPHLRDTALYRAHESYRNPRLENNGVNYLTPEHIDQLRSDSEQGWHEYKKPQRVPGTGIFRRIGIETEQGYTYDALVGIPEKPTCAVPVIGTTAWTTSLRGHNEHVVRNLTRAGNYVFFVGAEGSYVPDSPVYPKSPISLAASAATVLTFSHHMANTLHSAGHVVDLENRFVLGESRGGMVAEGIDALAEEFSQHILFSDQIAPCLPEKLSSATDLLRLGEQIVREPREMYKLLGSLTLSRLKYYPHTLDMRLDCIKDQVVIGGALFSGETGQLSLRTPDTTLKHITVFENDFASNRAWWEMRYGNSSRARITPLPGSHMTIADLTTLRYVIARNKAAQASVNDGSQLTTQVFDKSHEIAQAQVPITAETMNNLARPA